VLDFCLVVTDFKGNLLVFLIFRVKHPHLKLAVSRVCIISLLPDRTHYLFPFMHGMNAYLRQVLLVHLNEVDPAYLVFHHCLIDFGLAQFSHDLTKERYYLSTAPLHYVFASGSCASCTVVGWTYRLIAICGCSCYCRGHSPKSLILLHVIRVMLSRVLLLLQLLH